MRKIMVLVLLALSLKAEIFIQGSSSIGIKVGGASIGKEDYTIVGISENYFIIDNLSVGLGYEHWFSGDPDIAKATVESTYFIPVSEKVRPYIGVMYRSVFIGNSERLNRSFDDVNAYGHRAGIAFVQDNLLISAGIAQEKYDTTQNFLDDTETYAEIVVGFIF